MTQTDDDFQDVPIIVYNPSSHQDMVKAQYGSGAEMAKMQREIQEKNWAFIKWYLDEEEKLKTDRLVVLLLE